MQESWYVTSEGVETHRLRTAALRRLLSQQAVFLKSKVTLGSSTNQVGILSGNILPSSLFPYMMEVTVLLNKPSGVPLSWGNLASTKSLN